MDYNNFVRPFLRMTKSLAGVFEAKRLSRRLFHCCQQHLWHLRKLKSDNGKMLIISIYICTHTHIHNYRTITNVIETDLHIHTCMHVCAWQTEKTTPTNTSVCSSSNNSNSGSGDKLVVLFINLISYVWSATKITKFC